MRKLILVTILSVCYNFWGQDNKKEVFEHFKNTRVINLQSVDVLASGIMEMKIQHRFGPVSDGAYEFFGLDQASMRIGFEQGIGDFMMLGLGRNSFQKTFDGFVKCQMLWQKENGMPISLTYYTAMNLNGTKPPADRKNYFTSKLAFVHQLIVSKKFTERYTLQLSPTLLHRNLVEKIEDRNTTGALGVAFNFNYTKNISFNVEYVARLLDNVNSEFYKNNHNALSVGIGVKTKGHFFEIHLTNAQSMAERGFIAETSGSWLEGNISPGFNLTRDFRVYKKR